MRDVRDGRERDERDERERDERGKNKKGGARAYAVEIQGGCDVCVNSVGWV